MSTGKFILLHVDNEDSKALLEDVILNQGVERGVFFGSKFISELKEQFSIESTFLEYYSTLQDGTTLEGRLLNINYLQIRFLCFCC